MARGARHVVVLVAHAGIEPGDGMADAPGAVRAKLLFHLADEGGVLVEQAAVVGADLPGRRRPRSPCRSSRMLRRLS